MALPPTQIAKAASTECRLKLLMLHFCCAHLYVVSLINSCVLVGAWPIACAKSCSKSSRVTGHGLVAVEWSFSAP